jgi:hypothetical protein
LCSFEIGLNVSAPDEYASEIERYIRTFKERMRGMGYLNVISPREIITGNSLDYNLHCTYQFGDYVQTHEQHDNSMQSRTIGALAMRPTGNVQGSYYFYSLLTGRIINQRNATKLAMPTEVIDRIEVLAIKDNDLMGISIDESFSQHRNSDIDSYVNKGDVAETLCQDNNMLEIAEVNNCNESTQDYNVLEEEMDANVNHSSGIQEGHNILSNNDYDEVSVNDSDLSENAYSSDIEFANIDDTNNVMSDEDENNEYNIDDDMDKRYGTGTSNYNLRPRRERTYKHLF